jgi:hypothetical protein
MSPRLLLMIGLALLLSAASAAPAGAMGSDDITAVSSKVHNGYKRTLLADGSFKTETYGFAVGGVVSRRAAALESTSELSASDSTIDGVSFASISRIIQGPLAARRYVPTDDPKRANLLIVVFWGRTVGTNSFGGTSMAVVNGGDRDAIDMANAKLLGFDTEHVFDQGFQDHSNMMANIRREVSSGTIDAIEDDRYFVVLQAFDFQELYLQKHIKLLWETRFSLSQRHHDFGQDLAGMTQIASEYFGADSQGLVTKPIPEGHVDVGETRNLGDVPAR